LGLKLETDVPESTECIDAVVFFFDDYYYFQNNITAIQHNLGRWEAPIMNFTRMVGGNFSDIP
jgi:hypothetical protein